MDETVLLNDKRLPSPPIVLVETPGGGVGVKAAKPDRTGQRNRHDCKPMATSVFMTHSP